MSSTLTYQKECLVYPGEYTLRAETEALLRELKIHDKDSVARLPVNIDEFEDSYKVEMVMPGMKREDIFIEAAGNILSIIVLCSDSEKWTAKKSQMHEFDTKTLERHIFLPENANTEFVSAEYRRGILSLYIPKTDQPSETNTKQIVVY